MESRHGIYFLVKRKLIWATLLISHATFANVLQSVPDALSKVCPEPAVFEKKNEYLDKDQIKKMNEAMEFKMDERGTLVTLFECRKDGKVQSTAYVDIHEVRKEKETLMIVVTPIGEVVDIEVLQFDEPKEYAPPSPWLRQFEHKSKKDMGKGKSSVVGITGATLTSRAISRSVQKILAIHSALNP